MAALREPLVHFLLLGILLFGLHAALGGRLLEGRDRIVIDADVARAIADSQERQLGRRPSEAELRGAIQRRVEDLVLLAEARRRGLDEGDVIVDRRLIQKAGFLLEGAPSPTAEELSAYYSTHADRYARPTRVVVRQRFFSGSQEDAEAEAAEALLTGALGDPFALGRELRGTVAQVQGRLGLDVDLAELPMGEWAGPYVSQYGAHLLRLEERSVAKGSAFDAAAVERDWLRDERDRAREAGLARLVERASVVIEADLAEIAR